MKRRFFISVKKAKYYNLITAISVGIVVIISLISVCALCITKIDVSEAVIGTSVNFVMCAGGFASGFRYGKLKRHKGIANGIKCGLCLSLIVMIFGLLYLKKIVFFQMIKKIFFLCVSGGIGGIIGVNTKIRKPPY